MHIETLKIFCDLAELRSFSKTAEKHLLSQSAVSQQIAQLELVHKCELLDRKKRPLELTPSGQSLHRAARDIIDRYEQFRSELNTLKSTAERKINIAAIYSIGMHILPEYVKKFMVSHPDVNVHIEYFRSDKIYESVLAGDIDIGMVAVPRKDKRLEVYDFEDEPLMFVCSPKHPLAAESLVDIHQLQFERFVAFEQSVPTRKWIDSILQRYSVIIHPIMEFDNIETVKRAVEINAGVSMLPQTAILQEIGSGTLKAISFSNENFIRPTGIIIRKGKIFSDAGKYLIELMRKKRE